MRGADREHVLGLVVARHFLKLDALADLSDRHVAEVLQPWLTGGGGAPGRRAT